MLNYLVLQEHPFLMKMHLQIREGEEASYKTTQDIFEKQLHAYTITHAIDDKNVLRFHIDYFKGKGENKQNQAKQIAQQAVVEAILEKHDAATNSNDSMRVGNGFYQQRH
jgi:type I site-specific restriction-modification system R (restriction) subunit